MSTARRPARGRPGRSGCTAGLPQESLAIWRELGDDVRVASCLGDLGAVAHIRGEYAAARSMYAEALELAERAGDAQQMGRALSGLGRLALHQGVLDKPTEYYTDSMARFRDIGDLRRATLILDNLGVVATNLGDLSWRNGGSSSTSTTPGGWVTTS